MQSATARLRNAEKAKKANGNSSQLAANASAATTVCKICRQSFICTAKPVVLQSHVDSKHAKNTFAECFPDAQAA
jgi:transcription elongation factor Elf1